MSNNFRRALVLLLPIFLMMCAKRQAPEVPASVQPNVMLIIFNPIIESEQNKTLVDLFNWHNPDSLAQVYAADLKEVSQGYLNYRIVARVEVDEFPIKLDGFRYTDESFLTAWRTRDGFHQPDNVDYNAIFNQFDIFNKVERREIDEVWCFTFPYSGFWESTMAGAGAFYCNSDPVPGTGHCSRRFITMGFNYERCVGCMLEDFGHLTESIMSHVFRHAPAEQNYWTKFTLYDKVAPGQSQCGNVHFAPNSEKDYDWGNPRFVTSFCDDWYNFPNFKGVSRSVNCEEWGSGDMRGHHRWWLKHIPHMDRSLNGISNNWWYYMSDVNCVQ
ncbi:MAG: hypothetical protein ACOY90_13770 [Candidatus Zhuqueibacterota bacterium]